MYESVLAGNDYLDTYESVHADKWVFEYIEIQRHKYSLNVIR